jgi:hypothetical protein
MNCPHGVEAEACLPCLRAAIRLAIVDALRLLSSIAHCRHDSHSATRPERCFDCGAVRRRAGQPWETPYLAEQARNLDEGLRRMDHDGMVYGLDFTQKNVISMKPRR